MHNGMHYTVLRSAAESAQPQFFFAKKAAPCLWGLYLQALLGRAVNVKRKLGLWPQGATSEEPGASRDNGSIAPPSTLSGDLLPRDYQNRHPSHSEVIVNSKDLFTSSLGAVPLTWSPAWPTRSPAIPG